MPPLKKKIPPIRPNEDGSGFTRIGGSTQRRGMPVGPVTRGRQSTTPLPLSGSISGSEGSLSPEANRIALSDNRGILFSREKQRSEVPHGGHRISATSPQQADRLSPKSAHTKFLGQEGSTPVDKPRKPGADLTAGAAARSTMGTDSLLPASTNSLNARSAPLKMQYDAALWANECRMHPSIFHSLGIPNGSVVKILIDDATSSVAAFAEAFLSTSIARDHLVVSEDFSFLVPLPVNSTVRVALVRVDCATSSFFLPLIKSITIEASIVRNEPGVLDSTSSSSSFQWRALFRENFQNRLVFVNLHATLRLFSHTVLVKVTHLVVEKECDVWRAEGVTFGVLTNGTTIEASGWIGDQSVEGCDGDAVATISPSLTSTTPGDFTKITTSVGHVLVVGESGTGKTYTLEGLALADRMQRRRKVFTLRVEELAQGDKGEVHTITVLREYFHLAKLAAPATIIMDDLDLLCGAAAQGSSLLSSVGSQWAISIFTRVLCAELARVHGTGSDPLVRVVASMSSMDSVDALLLAPDRFAPENIVVLRSPANAEERRSVLTTCIAHRFHSTTHCDGAAASVWLDEKVLQDVAAHAHGFNQRDLMRVVELAMMESFQKKGTTRFVADDLLRAAKVVRPSALKGFEVTIPTVTWNDIGGSEEAKKTLQEVVEWSLGKQSWVFEKFNLTPPKGVLLYGPPGCSKTMLAKALANESRMNFISVKGPEVFSKWVGDSEKAVRDVFARARAAAPCVVFIDELDGMCGHRGHGGVSDRVIAQFLTELDGLPAAFSDKSNALVFVAATNRPDNIDSAVLRPGRIDRRVHVGLPTVGEREAIARIQFKRLPTAADLTPVYLAERTEGYTGAEVVAVVKEAAFTAISNDLNAALVSVGDVDIALTKVKPRVNPKDVEWYRLWPQNPCSG